MTSGEIRNGLAIPLRDVPLLDPQLFRQRIIDRVLKRGARIASMFAMNQESGGGIQIFAILANDLSGKLLVSRTELQQDSFDSMVREVPQAHLFEREIAEQFGLRPEGHPWLKPVRFHSPYHTGHDAKGNHPKNSVLPGVQDFFQVHGEEVHEVAVGPVHAGVIEPGHFRFQCHGEVVFHLEIALGYQHRGIERVVIGGPHLQTIHQMEAIAGDTTIGHTLAYCQAIEALSGTVVSARAQAIRGIALELERLANHTGDLGALAGDVAYLPTASFCGRLRGDFLNMTAAICGSRFGRGLVRPGGVAFDLEPEQIQTLRQQLITALKEVKESVQLLWETPTVLERFESTGRVSTEDAEMNRAGGSGSSRLRSRSGCAPRLPDRHLPVCASSSHDFPLR